MMGILVTITMMMAPITLQLMKPALAAIQTELIGGSHVPRVQMVLNMNTKMQRTRICHGNTWSVLSTTPPRPER